MTEHESGWTFEQNKRFEQALALVLDEDGDGAQDQEIGQWKKVAAMVPGKSQADVRRHFALLLQDVAAIEAGQIALPHYHRYSSSSSPTRSWEDKCGALYGKGSKASEERKKGIPWTEEEHRQFLLGLDKFGKGDWRSISRNFVVSRTPTQVASHAQKYFIRLNSINKDKRRSSIHDITNAASSPPPPTAAYPPPKPPPPAHCSFPRPPLHLPPLSLLPPSHLPYAMHHHQ